MAKYMDFDAMFAEMKSETIPFKAFGEEYSIPKRIPASIVLEMARKEKEDSLSTEFLLRAAVQIFGDETLDALCKHPEFTVDKLGAMIRWAFAAINGNDDESEEVSEDDIGVAESKN